MLHQPTKFQHRQAMHGGVTDGSKNFSGSFFMGPKEPQFSELSGPNCIKFGRRQTNHRRSQGMFQISDIHFKTRKAQKPLRSKVEAKINFALFTSVKSRARMAKYPRRFLCQI